MQHHFTSKTPVNTKFVKELFMVKTENDWKLELEPKPKLRVYKTFKINMKQNTTSTHTYQNQKDFTVSSIQNRSVATRNRNWKVSCYKGQ